MGRWESVRQRIIGAHPDPEPLPGRPPVGRPGAPGPARTLRAICCSGGGIRAAAFALGGIQGLQERREDKESWYDGVDLVTAVSGGSYLAGSLAMVNHGLTDDERTELPPYAIGSPEDNRLRNHTRYLVEDPKVAALGVLGILYGLLLNLLPILAGGYVAAKLLGLALHEWGVLSHDGSGWHVRQVGAVALPVAAVAAAGLLAFAAERLHDVYRPQRAGLTDFLRAWSLRLLGLAALGAAAFLGVPYLLQLLPTTSRLDPGVSGTSLANQWATFVAAITGLVALVKATLGRFKGTLQTSTSSGPNPMTAWTGRILRAAAPWAGSAVAVLLLLAAFLAWTASTAYDGLHTREYVLIGAAVLGCLGWQALTDINRNSAHPFYKERLSSAYAVERVGPHARERRYATPIRLSEYGRDRPQLVICAAVNTDEEGRIPSGRGCAPFTFSPVRTGISSGTMFAGEAALTDGLTRRTEDYENAAGPRLVTLPGAVAVSGAAVSPVMGRMTRAPLRLLLGLANVRLGLWLPNPQRQLRTAPGPGAPYRKIVAWQFRQPGIRQLLREILGSISLSGRWIYVTDGGHYENLGLVEALRRGAKEIVAFDASGDPPGSWVTFGEAVETARADLGVEIDLDPSTMRPADGSDRAATLVVKGTCTYPDGQQATLLYCKLALPEKARASWDVYAWKAGHAAFPNDPTTQQLYGDREFEAYRRLGQLAAGLALDELDDEKKKWTEPAEPDLDAALPPPNGVRPLRAAGSSPAADRPDGG
jgi:hypothetical protein